MLACLVGVMQSNKHLDQDPVWHQSLKEWRAKKSAHLPLSSSPPPPTLNLLRYSHEMHTPDSSPFSYLICRSPGCNWTSRTASREELNKHHNEFHGCHEPLTLLAFSHCITRDITDFPIACTSAAAAANAFQPARRSCTIAENSQCSAFILHFTMLTIFPARNHGHLEIGHIFPGNAQPSPQSRRRPPLLPAQAKKQN